MFKTYELIDDLKKWYFRQTKRNLNIENPQTYNEKLQWLKIFNALPIKTQLADKYLVREWIKEKIGGEYLVPILGVYDSVNEINFDNLPNQFVIKCNHGSGYNLIVKDKSNLNIPEVKTRINKWMHENFAFNCGFELHYRDIKPKIIIEKFIDPIESSHEIQVWCFDNNIKFVSVETNKDLENLSRGTFYLDETPTEFEISPNHYKRMLAINDKKAFHKAIDLAKKLLIDVPYVRIDFIEWHGDVKFREMTFTSGTGLSYIKPTEYNKLLGSWITLPELAYDLDTKTFYEIPKKKLKSRIVSRIMPKPSLRKKKPRFGSKKK